MDGFPLIVVDGLLGAAEINRWYESLCGVAFTRSEVARPETQAFKHWAWAITLEKCRQLPFHQLAQDAIQRCLGQRGPQRLYRAYCNLCTYGDMLFTHTDSQPEAEELTALWYIAAKWDVEWGGETVFFDSDGDAKAIVSPKPGRLAIFDGRIRHAGRPPNRICTEPRLTFALKFETVSVGPSGD